jgi:hypothetical protein
VSGELRRFYSARTIRYSQFAILLGRRSVTETTKVTLRGKRFEIDDEKRARVRAEMPEIDWIKDEELRRK